jgi:hypothetical protein
MFRYESAARSLCPSRQLVAVDHGTDSNLLLSKGVIQDERKAHAGLAQLLRNVVQSDR